MERYALLMALEADSEGALRCRSQALPTARTINRDAYEPNTVRHPVTYGSSIRSMGLLARHLDCS